MLVKPVEGLYRDWPPGGKPLARLSVDELAELRAAGRAAGVDQHLPEVLRAAGVEAWVIDGREPARLVTLLEHGSTEGTRIRGLDLTVPFLRRHDLTGCPFG